MEINNSIIIRRSLKRKYSFDSNKLYSKLVIDSLLSNKKTSLVCKFKENMITDYIFDFFKRVYSVIESSNRIPILEKYYSNYLKFFCTPIFSDLKINKLIRHHNDLKAEFYYYRIHLSAKTSQKACNKKSINCNLYNKFNFETKKEILTKGKVKENDFFDKKIKEFIDGYQNSELYLAKLEFDNSSIKFNKNTNKNQSNSFSKLSILSLIDSEFPSKKDGNKDRLVKTTSVNNKFNNFRSNKNLNKYQNENFFKTTENLLSMKLISILNTNSKEKQILNNSQKKNLPQIMNINMNTYNIINCNLYQHNSKEKILNNSKSKNEYQFSKSKAVFHSDNKKSDIKFTSKNENEKNDKKYSKNDTNRTNKSMSKLLKDCKLNFSTINTINASSNKKIDFTRKTIDVDLFEGETIPNAKLFQTIKNSKPNQIKNYQFLLKSNIKSRNNNYQNNNINNLGSFYTANTKESINKYNSKENLNYNKLKIPNLVNSSRNTNKLNTIEKNDDKKVNNKVIKIKSENGNLISTKNINLYHNTLNLSNFKPNFLSIKPNFTNMKKTQNESNKKVDFINEKDNKKLKEKMQYIDLRELPNTKTTNNITSQLNTISSNAIEKIKFKDIPNQNHNQSRNINYNQNSLLLKSAKSERNLNNIFQSLSNKKNVFK